MRRVIAAVLAVLLAAVGAMLVFVYADRADERAAQGQVTRPVLVATQPVAAGTSVADLGDAVETRELPAVAVLDGALDSLDQLSDRVLAVDMVAGEQVVTARLVTEEEIRARGTTGLPEGTEDAHQVTLLLDKERALGGDIAPGDRVGVFMSFDIKAQPGDSAQVEQDGTPSTAISVQNDVSVTDLTLHRVPVLRVEGAYVPAPTTNDGEEGAAEDRVFVTLAVDPEDAARLVYGTEWGQIWLSLEPEGASDDALDPIVIVIPDDATDVLQ